MERELIVHTQEVRGSSPCAPTIAAPVQLGLYGDAFLSLPLLALFAATNFHPVPVRIWTARWISANGSSPNQEGVYHFRRSFTLDASPSQFVVHVSADNRYQLFVNGHRVASGPARGDLYHWQYDTIDIASSLNAGRNVIAAVVWNWGEHAPLAQISAETGFLLQGDSNAEAVVNTNASWRARNDNAHTFLPVTAADVGRVYYVAAPGEHVDGSKYPWGWTEPDFDETGWQPARAKM